MKTIKFRAWDKVNKQLIDLGGFWIPLVDKEGKGLKLIHLKLANAFQQDNTYEALQDEIELMQFTGLLDKNGVEIFEGDIFEHIGADGQKHKHKVFYYESSATWSIANVLTNPHAWREGEEEYEIEVIGNIYENPELLTS